MRRTTTAAPIVAETAHAPTSRQNAAIHSGHRRITITTQATRAAAIRSRGPTIRRLRVLTPHQVAVIRHRAAITRRHLAAAIPLRQVAAATQRLAIATPRRAVAEAATPHRAIAPVAVEAPITVVEEAVLLMVAAVRRTRAANLLNI